MSQMSQAGVVVLEDDACQSWQPDIPALLDVVAELHRSGEDYKGIGPRSHDAWQAQKAALFDAAPGLQEFADGLKQRLRSATAVLLPSVGLEGYSVDERAKIAYALASCIGNPTATDKRQVVWDVLARKRDSTYFSTFSETDGEAAYHTDTQYYPEPEPSFALYCMEPARCGGGYSSVLDARALRDDIERNQPWLADALSTKLLPFRVPSAFVTTGDPNTIQATLAPVFADTPMIRYRRDTLEAGLKYFPEYGDADVHRAMDEFELQLSKCPHQVEFFMPRDSLVLIDNHRALHARTSFQDHQRHLLRIRVQENATPKQPSIFKMVQRTSELPQLQTH